MLVSVIITVYNLEQYVEKSILSVLEQSYTDLEILVIDDCSTDLSAEIIGKYSQQVKCLRTKKNSGVLLATIEGLQNATGDILCFLDGDDIWHKDKVFQIVTAFRKDKSIVMVSHDYEYVNENGNVLSRTDNSQVILKKNNSDQAFINKKMKDSVLGYFGNVWLGSAYCLKNDKQLVTDFISCAKQLPNPEYTYQDHPLASFWIVNNKEGFLAYIDQKLLQYRIHEHNYSGAYHNKATARKLAFKAYNTSAATLSITKNSGVGNYLIKRQIEKLAYYEFLLALFDKKNSKAFALNLKLSFGFYSKKDFIKEWSRYFGVLVLGNYFFKILNKR
jgi:glycosyltransferase involved in cell wall biosynthesis